jgi:hypothetical protein
MSIDENIKITNFCSLKNVDIDVLESEFNDLKKKIIIFKSFEKGDKLMKDLSENSYWKCENNKYQTVTRWWHSEDRKKTIKYLDEEFKIFAKLLDKILYNLKDKHLLKYYTLALDVVKYINEIIPGLYSLKETYKDYKEMQDKVDSIITTFIDYKDQIEEYKNKEHNRRVNLKHLAIRKL